VHCLHVWVRILFVDSFLGKFIVYCNAFFGELFVHVDKFEQKIISKGALSPLIPPFSGQINPFLQNATVKVHFPSEDEENGSVTIGWRGPVWENLADRSAIEVVSRHRVVLTSH